MGFLLIVIMVKRVPELHVSEPIFLHPPKKAQLNILKMFSLIKLNIPLDHPQYRLAAREKILMPPINKCLQPSKNGTTGVFQDIIAEGFGNWPIIPLNRPRSKEVMRLSWRLLFSSMSDLFPLHLHGSVEQSMFPLVWMVYLACWGKPSKTWPGILILYHVIPLYPYYWVLVSYYFPF